MKAFATLLLLVMLPGCAFIPKTKEQLAKIDTEQSAKCVGWGAPEHSPLYVYCRTALDQNDAIRESGNVQAAGSLVQAAATLGGGIIQGAAAAATVVAH